MTDRAKKICMRCIKKEHDAGKSMVTVPVEVLGKCSYCGVENWIFEVGGDVPAQTIADMPELEVEKPKKRKKREVGESIPNPIEELKHGISKEKAEAVIELMEEPSDAEYAKVTKLITEEEKEPVEKSLEDMTEDELRARLAELKNNGTHRRYA